jgi:hypothetical protein
VQQSGLKEIYDLYSFNVIPRIGGIVANDSASYQYLVESIRTFPDQVCPNCVCLHIHRRLDGPLINASSFSHTLRFS